MCAHLVHVRNPNPWPVSTCCRLLDCLTASRLDGVVDCIRVEHGIQSAAWVAVQLLPSGMPQRANVDKVVDGCSVASSFHIFAVLEACN